MKNRLFIFLCLLISIKIGGQNLSNDFKKNEQIDSESRLEALFLSQTRIDYVEYIIDFPKSNYLGRLLDSLEVFDNREKGVFVFNTNISNNVIISLNGSNSILINREVIRKENFNIELERIILNPDKRRDLPAKKVVKISDEKTFLVPDYKILIFFLSNPTSIEFSSVLIQIELVINHIRNIYSQKIYNTKFVDLEAQKKDVIIELLPFNIDFQFPKTSSVLPPPPPPPSAKN